MVTIRTRTGVHSGRSVETIVRRWYGRTAEIRWSSDPNSPELGLVVRPADQRRRAAGSGTQLVLDKLIAVITS